MENTLETLTLAKKRALELGIKQIIVSSTTGDTAVKAAEVFTDTAIKLVVVTHSFGFLKDGVSSFDPGKRAELESRKIPILMGTMILSSPGRSLRSALGWATKEGKYMTLFPTDIIADTLRMFSQGMKVCVEISVMAADAGLVPITEDIIAIAGTARGADTAVVMKTAYSKNIFNTKIREIIVVPSL